MHRRSLRHDSPQGLPGPLNVSGRVLVAVEHQPTGGTDVGADREAFRDPLLQHLVVHDDDSSPWVVAGLMMDWPGLPAGSSAGIGHIDGLRRGALCLQERVG